MYKQIIIVRKDLHMSSGKLAAQVSHASMAFLAMLIKEHVIGEVFDWPTQTGLQEKGVYRINSFDIEKGLYENWLKGAFTKTVLEAKNKNKLLKAKEMAEEMGWKEGEDFFLIKDNCYTELEPEETDESGAGRTLTCIGFRPMEAEIIDKIGRKYHLYT